MTTSLFAAALVALAVVVIIMRRLPDEPSDQPMPRPPRDGEPFP